MALQPEIRTDSLEGQLPDSLPATEAALRESIFRLRDSLATIPPVSYTHLTLPTNSRV